MKTVHKMKVGMTYSRELESNASTGYDWILSSKPPTFLQINSETKMNEDGRIGGNTKTVITIKAIKKGKARLVFHYKRSWEKGVKPIKSEVINVEVE